MDCIKEVYINQQAIDKIEELDKLGIKIYSFSKLDNAQDCLFGFYKEYVEKDKKNKQDNIYSILGVAVHECLEQAYNSSKEEDWSKLLSETFEKAYSQCIENKIYFPTDTIRENYINSITNYCATFKKDNHKSFQEQIFLMRIDDDIWVRGFIDRVLADDTSGKDSLRILDYKTSTLYGKNELPKKGRQLVLYGIAVEHSSKYPVTSLCWDMLKYVDVQYTGKTRKRKRIFDRHNFITVWRSEIIESLEEVFNGEEDYENIIYAYEQAVIKNKIPVEIEDKFILSPAWVSYPFTKETKEECIEWIRETVKTINNTTEFLPKEIDSHNSFKCIHVCSYRGVCPYIKKFVQSLSDFAVESGINYEDLF